MVSPTKNVHITPLIRDVWKRKKAIISDDLCGAENETRTRDPNLGKVVLYQLSYFRKWDCKDR